MSEVEERLVALEHRIAELEAQRLQSLGAIHGVSVVLQLIWRRQWFASGTAYQAHADQLADAFIQSIDRVSSPTSGLTDTDAATVKDASRQIAREMANMMVNATDPYEGPKLEPFTL